MTVYVQLHLLPNNYRITLQADSALLVIDKVLQYLALTLKHSLLVRNDESTTIKCFRLVSIGGEIEINKNRELNKNTYLSKEHLTPPKINSHYQSVIANMLVQWLVQVPHSSRVLSYVHMGFQFSLKFCVHLTLCPLKYPTSNLFQSFVFPVAFKCIGPNYDRTKPVPHVSTQQTFSN